MLLQSDAEFKNEATIHNSFSSVFERTEGNEDSSVCSKKFYSLGSKRQVTSTPRGLIINETFFLNKNLPLCSTFLFSLAKARCHSWPLSSVSSSPPALPLCVSG